MVNVYKGALHIHTKYSDGSSDIKEIAAAAKKAGLSWIIVTDHNNLAGLHNNEEGWYDGVAVLIGEEISPENSDHYLAFGINQDISPDLPPENYINKVKDQGGMGFIAHPDEKTDRNNDFRPLRWTDWNVQGFDGIEIWNFLSDWVDGYDAKKALYCYLKKNHVLSGPTSQVLKWWDDLNNVNSHIVPAIGGVDAHALIKKYYGFKVKIFPYYQSFKTVTNYLYLDEKLSSDIDKAKSQVYTALKQGRNTIINSHWNSPKSEFSYYIKSKQICTYPGGTTELDDDSRMIIKTPRKAKIKLIYNGKPVLEIHNSQLLILDELKKGKYRVEVYYKDHPWVFTNPISIV